MTYMWRTTPSLDIFLMSDIIESENSIGYAHMYKLEAQPGNRYHWIYKKCWITHISPLDMPSVRTFLSEPENS